tara:strand:- start:2398 stop:6603 length:4206 start_codon:yes stop_codon:yes gene_type:complete
MSRPDQKHTLPVGADMLCIPDNIGTHASKLGLSIQCSPMWVGVVEDIGDRFTAELAHWPSTIHAQPVVEVYVASDMGADPVPLANTTCVTHSVMKAAWREQANILWAKAFRYEKDQPTDFTPLWNQLKERKTEKLALSSVPLRDRQAAMMVEFIEQLRAAGRSDELCQRMEGLWEKCEALLNNGTKADAADTFMPGSKPDYERTDRLQAAINAFVATDLGNFEAIHADEIAMMFRDFLAQFAEAADMGPATKLAGEPCPTAEESSELKLNAILDVPSLAHFFGCGVYVDLDPAEIVQAAGQTGYIAARFSPPSGDGGLPAMDTLVWTAYAIDLQDRRKPFIPRAEGGTKANPDYIGEYLNLHQKQTGGQDLRYRISQVLPEASVLGEVVARRLAATRGQKRDPMALKDDARQRGIALWDKQATQAAQEEEMRFVTQDNVNYLHDLVKGVRPDIQADGGAMYCPTTRSIRCDDPEFPQGFYQHEFVKTFLLYRDHAFTQDATLTQGQRAVAEKRGALFIFLGEPIGLGRDELQASNRHRTVSQIKVCEGLALKIIFGPDSIERLSQDCHIKPECADQLNWPTLREGSVYRVGCRITYLNGAGPGRDYMEVREAYQQGAPTLGTSASQAFPFEAAQIEPPRVCLHQFDKVVQRDRKKFPGSNAHTVVLAHDDKQYRVVLPPSIAWDSAEQQGQFDGVNNPARLAAFGNELLLDGDGFSLPEARYRGLYFVSGDTARQAVDGNWKFKFGQETGTWADERQSLGPVAHFTPHTRGRRMYFVDRNAKGFTISVDQNTAETVTYRESGKPVPRALAIKQVARTEKQVKVSRAKNIDIEPGGNSTRFDGAIIEVPAGRKIDVELIPTSDVVQNTLRKATLKIVSPIKQPVAPADGSPVGVSARYVDAPDAETLELNLQKSTRSAHGKPMATVAYFEGNIQVDARATGKVVVNAAWQDWSAKGWYADCLEKTRDGKCAPDNREFRFATKRPSAPIGTIDAKFEDGSNEWKDIQLDKCEMDSGKSKVTLPFNEGLARKIHLTLQAESEFSAYYPGVDAADLTSSTTIAVKLACTFRGKQLQIASDDPILVWETLSYDKVWPNNRSHFEGKRSEKRRIYLEGELFVTGISECVGVIVPSSQQKKRIGDHEDLAKFVSECGIDPFFEAGNQPAVIKPEMLGGSIGVERDVVVVVNENQEDSRNGLVDPLVSDLVLFEYKLDDEKRPYIEIDVSDLAEQAHRPVLHLGFVRFQPNALNHKEADGKVIDLRASKPIRKDVKLMPSRHYRWDYDRGKIDVWLKGEMVEPANVVLHRYAWAWTGDRNKREWCWELVDTLPCTVPLQDGKVIFRARDLSKSDITEPELRNRLPDDFRTLFRIEENETYTDVEANTKCPKSINTFVAAIYPHDKFLPD